MEIEILDIEIILLIHKRQICLHGGDIEYRDDTLTRIESILLKQYEEYFGYEKYPSIFNKAAMLLYFFAKGHCFMDGNKRVGYASCLLFLELNGYEFRVGEKEAELKTLEVASSNLKNVDMDNYILDNLSSWISFNTVQIE